MRIHTLEWRSSATNAKLATIVAAIAIALLVSLTGAHAAGAATLGIDTTITSAPPANSSDTTPTFAFTSNVSGASFACSVDSGSYKACSSPFTAAALGQGSHNFKVRAQKLFLADLTPASANFKIDSIAPLVKITAPVAGNTTASSVVLKYTVTDAGGSLSCDRANNSTVPLSFGSTTITVRCTDLAGNVGQASVVVKRPDTVAPAVNITSPAAGSTTASSATLTFTATDNSGVAPTCDRTSGAVVALVLGANTITVKCTDAAGNLGQASVTVTRTDNVPPVITNISPADGFTTSGANVTLSFAVTDDSGTTPTCNRAPSGSTINLSIGANTIAIDCVDGSGNHLVTQVVYIRTNPADTTPPVVTITSPGGGYTFNSAAALSFTVNEPATTTCSLDGGADGPCASSRSYFGLSQGRHTFVVRATDTAGNVGTASTYLDVNGAADIPVVPPDGSSFKSTTVTMSVGIFYDGGPGTCSLDDGPATACSLPVTYTNLSEGGHKFHMEEAGQLNWTSRFTVDLTAPALSVTSPAAGYVSTDGSVPVSLSTEVGSRTTCKIDSGAIQLCDSGTTLSGVLAGSHTLTIESSDVAGNKTTVTRSFSASVPVVDANFKTPAAGSWSNTASPSVTFDNLAGYTTTCALDGGSPQACTSPYTLNSISQGAHSASVTWLSGSGAATTFTHSFSVDSIAPEISVQNLTSGQVLTSTTYDVQFTATEANPVRTSCFVDSGTNPANANGTCTSPATFTDMYDGPHVLRLGVTDAANNFTSLDIPFTVTGNPGMAVIYYGPPAVISASDAYFNFYHQSPLVTQFECRMDADAFAPCTNGYHATGLAVGAHQFQVRGVRNGVPDATPATRTFTVQV
jgi:hypothetical protein